MSGFDLSNFLAAFFDEARERLTSINRWLVEFESDSIDDEGLAALRRDAHTIKGSALMLGVTDIGAMAHLFEDAMEHLIKIPEARTPKMTQLLYDLHDQLVDRLDEVDTVERLDTKTQRARYDGLLQELEQGNLGERVAEPQVAVGSMLIGAEEAADWKKHSAEGNKAAFGATSEQVVNVVSSTAYEEPPEEEVPLAADDGASSGDITDVVESDDSDIDAMLPDGMFVDDSMDALFTSGGDEGLEVVAESPDDSIDSAKDVVEFSIDDSTVDSDLDDVFSFDDATNTGFESLLDGLQQPEEEMVVFSDGDDELLSLEDVAKEAVEEAAQLEAQAVEQAKAEAREVEEARIQAQARAAAELQMQAEAKAADEALLQAKAMAKAAEEALALAQAEAKVAEDTQKKAKADQEARIAAEAANEQARKQAASIAAEQADIKAAEQIKIQANARAAEQIEMQANAREQAAKAKLTGAVEEVKRVAPSSPPRSSIQEPSKIAEGVKETGKSKPISRSNHFIDNDNLEKNVAINRFKPVSAVSASSTGSSTGQRKASGRFLRVDTARLEELSSYVVELSTERSRGEEVEKDFGALQREFRELRVKWRTLYQDIDRMNPGDEQLRLMASMDRSFDRGMRKMSAFIETQRFNQLRGDLMLKDLRDQVLSLMLRPLDNVLSTFPRAVRDIAIKLEKRVKLVIDGSSVEIDQGISEMLVEPLVHLLNNAVSHGVETPAERRAVGKPEVAQVSIIAQQSGSEIHIEVVDDGKGLDVDLIKAVAVERGVTTQVEVDQMDSAEILEMIFRPGFTTKKDVSDVSGRGIGMNVVQDAVRRLTGSIRIDSEKGKGTRFLLSLPVSIAVQHALVFKMANVLFGMLIHLVEQILPLSTQTIEKGPGDKDFIRYGRSLVSLVDMRKMFAADDAQVSDNPVVIIAEHIEGFVGIVVDEMIDELEVVVRDLDPYIKRYQPQGLMGTTISPDGTVLMLLEPYGIKEMGRTAPDHAISIEVSEEDKMRFSVLLVEDSLIARQIEKSVFESIGFDVETAIDGLDGLDKMKSATFDLIVTDLEMPRLDGFGFVRRIRNQPEYEDLPIMVISTRESAEDRMRALEAGADAYMIKQKLQGDKILETVQSLIGSVEQAAN